MSGEKALADLRSLVLSQINCFTDKGAQGSFVNILRTLPRNHQIKKKSVTKTTTPSNMLLRQKEEKKRNLQSRRKLSPPCRRLLTELHGWASITQLPLLSCCSCLRGRGNQAPAFLLSQLLCYATSYLARQAFVLPKGGPLF